MTKSILHLLYISEDQNFAAHIIETLRTEYQQVEVTPLKAISEKTDNFIPDLTIIDCREDGKLRKQANPEQPTICITKRRISNRSANSNALIENCIIEDITPPHFLSLARQLMERNRLALALTEVQGQLRERNMCDELTKLYNRTTFQEFFSQTVKEANRYKTRLALLILDIDGLRKFVRDHGHGTGEEVIAQFAGILQRSIREVDLAARWHQDAFVIALPETNLDQARILAERIRRTVNSTTLDNTDFNLPTISCGLSELRLARRSAKVLIESAEQALISAKEKGGDQLVIWNQDNSDSAGESKTSQNRINQLKTMIAGFTSEARQTYFNQLSDFFTANSAYQENISPHAKRVAELADRLAAHVGWRDHDRQTLQRASLLHDIGLAVFSEHIINKPTPLGPSETELVQQHPLIAVHLLDSALFVREELPIILHHHERFDGEGYPDRLEGNHIPKGARMLAIAEAWDRMTQPQPYREPLSHDEALNELLQNGGTQFDPELTEAFIQMIAG